MNLTPTPKELALAERKIKDFLKRYGCGFVVGMSGGLDSSLCAMLARRATKNVSALLMPEKGISNEKDTEDAEDLCKKLGIPHKIVDISDIVGDFKKKMDLSEKSEMNIKPRVRMTLLYMYANNHNVLVLGTSNRTELLLGYFTKYGDGGSDVCPLGGLFKTQVRALARHLGVPKEMLEKKPSAGLYEGQTDEKELGARYEEMDEILYHLFEKKRSVEETAKKLKIEIGRVEKFARRARENEHKRRSPPFPKF